MRIAVFALVFSIGFVNGKPLEMTETIEDYSEPLMVQKVEDPVGVGLVPDIFVDVHDVIHVQDDEEETAPELFLEPETVDNPELNVRFSNVEDDNNNMESEPLLTKYIEPEPLLTKYMEPEPLLPKYMEPEPLLTNDEVKDKNEFRLEELDVIKDEEPKELLNDDIVEEVLENQFNDEVEEIENLTNNNEQLKDPKPEVETVLEAMNDETEENEEDKNELLNEFPKTHEANGPSKPGSIWYFGPVVDRNIPSSRFMLPPVLQFPSPDLPNIFTNNPVNNFFVDKLKSLQDSLAVLITTLEGRDKTKTESEPAPEPETPMKA